MTLTNHHLLLVTDVAVFVTSDLRNVDGSASRGDVLNWNLAFEYGSNCDSILVRLRDILLFMIMFVSADSTFTCLRALRIEKALSSFYSNVCSVRCITNFFPNLYPAFAESFCVLLRCFRM